MSSAKTLSGAKLYRKPAGKGNFFYEDQRTIAALRTWSNASRKLTWQGGKTMSKSARSSLGSGLSAGSCNQLAMALSSPLLLAAILKALPTQKA